MTQQEVAKEFGVSRATVGHIWTGRTWAYLFDNQERE